MSGTATWSPDITDVEVARPVVEFVRAINAGDLDTAIARLAPDAVHRTRVSDYTPDGVRQLFGMLRRVFPDLTLVIDAQDVRGTRVTSRITATGTHRGSCLGRPATGERVAWTTVDTADVEAHASGRWVSARTWNLWNDPALYGPIGFVR
jgi:predicted ester cyclase